MKKYKILIVDDDEEIRQLIDTFLTGEGYQVSQVDSGISALKEIDDSYDMIILDIMMPEMNGYKVCSTIREQNNLPVLFLTAKGLDSDLTVGFSVGGDDYLVKPFSFAELLARIKGLLRRYYSYKGKDENVDEEYLLYKDLRINLKFNEVFKNDNELNLTEIEYQILKLLAKNRGKIFTMEMIYETIWNEPYFASSANTIMAHIRKIRVKIENNPQCPLIIKTVWGKGYRIE